MNQFIDKENQWLKEKGFFGYVWQLCANYFCDCIGFIFYCSTFAEAGDMLWVKDYSPQDLSGKNRNIECRNIWGEIDIF